VTKHHNGRIDRTGSKYNRINYGGLGLWLKAYYSGKFFDAVLTNVTCRFQMCNSFIYFKWRLYAKVAL